MPIMARVAMSGWTRPQVTTSPLNRPQPTPTRMASSAAGPKPTMPAVLARTTEARAITAATERSKPPATTTANWPTEMMPSRADWVSRLLMFPGERNAGAASDANTTKTARMT